VRLKEMSKNKKQWKNKIRNKNTDEEQQNKTKQNKKEQITKQKKKYLKTPSSAVSVIRVRCTARTFSSIR
jgi:hypothetical protein